MKLKKNIGIRYILLFIFMTFIILKFFNTPYNIYSILNWDYEKRMEQNYGNCKNESWGFYNYINKNFDLNNQSITILHDEGNVTLENLFNIKKEWDNSFKTNFLIILNYKSENNQSIFQSKYKFIKSYKIKYRLNNCYLMELND
tara:strand:+ start:135 stop:566 length:432 start_codon:yes stop_codon:yes gene_type:complete